MENMRSTLLTTYRVVRRIACYGLIQALRKGRVELLDVELGDEDLAIAR